MLKDLGDRGSRERREIYCFASWADYGIDMLQLEASWTPFCGSRMGFVKQGCPSKHRGCAHVFFRTSTITQYDSHVRA